MNCWLEGRNTVYICVLITVGFDRRVQNYMHNSLNVGNYIMSSPIKMYDVSIGELTLLTNNQCHIVFSVNVHNFALSVKANCQQLAALPRVVMLCICYSTS